MIKPVPVSLQIIQILTLLSALSTFLFFMVSLDGSAGGGHLYEIGFMLPLIVSASGLLLFIGMSHTYKIVWFASFIYWVLICVTFSSITHSIWTDYTSGEYAGFQNLEDWQIESLIVVLIPYAYAIGCSLWFLLSKNVRGYFGIKMKM
jgi:hypothetical protein